MLTRFATRKHLWQAQILCPGYNVSSETFLVFAWRVTMLQRFATDGQHRSRTQCCRHHVSSFCRGLRLVYQERSSPGWKSAWPDKSARQPHPRWQARKGSRPAGWRTSCTSPLWIFGPELQAWNPPKGRPESRNGMQRWGLLTKHGKRTGSRTMNGSTKITLKVSQ